MRDDILCVTTSYARQLSIHDEIHCMTKSTSRHNALRGEVLCIAHSNICSAQLQREIINDKIPFETDPWRCYMMPGIKTIWVLTRMALQIVDNPLTLAMKIMVLINPTIKIFFGDKIFMFYIR
jgi:hypothetical protein